MRSRAAASRAASATDFLAQLLILWLHDGVSEQGAPPGIVALKLDDRICGSSAVLAEFLDVACANDLQRRIPRERCECREFGAARATDAPRRLEHTRSWPTVSADPLSDVVVPARCRET